jgi:NAD-dependent SIR2 family protein deacetylase
MDNHPDYADLEPIEQLGAAKSFIALCLCRLCKEKTLDRVSRNLKDIDLPICRRCDRNIRRVLMNAVNWDKGKRAR